MTLEDVVIRGHPELPVEDSPDPTRGLVAHSDHGVSTCMRCNWRGVPTRVLNTDTMELEASHECPRCDVGPAVDEEEAALARTASAPKVGRNEPCPCGSGVKFKRCCG